MPMTPLGLQDGLIEEIKTILPDFTIFAQNIPPRKEQKELLPCPYIQIALGDGADDADEATQDVIVIVGVHDRTGDRQGYRDVMNAIECIRQRFKRNPYIKDQAMVKTIRWAAPEDDTQHPYYFGAVLLTCIIPQMELVSDHT